MSNELSTQTAQASAMQSYCFSSAQAFEAAQRMATALSKATLVPKEYLNNIPNCIIALEVAHRLNASPTMVMQNLYIVHGRPSWSSQFIISAVNSCGRFAPLQFHLDGEGDNWGCYVTTKDKSGELLKGPRVDIKMAKAEGWYGKNGSKWQTMPEMMLRYRAASFFGKLYAPDVLMGMYTQEEVEDIGAKDVTPRDNTALKDAFLAEGSVAPTSTEEANPEAEKPNALNSLLSGDKAAAVNQAQEELPVIAELVTVDGEVKKFPQDVNIIEIMQLLQDMPEERKAIFLDDNSKEWPQVISWCKANDKAAAAANLEKLTKGK
jgi:hypothetical protein